MANRSIPKKQYVCQVSECGRKLYATGYCLRHYTQIRRHGRLLGSPYRIGRFEPNKIILEGSLCKIELYDKYGYISNYAIIDSEDYHKIKNMRLCISGDGYVYITKNKKRLHQIILKSNFNDVDHKNGNLFDNRKINLRNCLHSQNCKNVRTSSRNTSGYKGVGLDIRKNKWYARICNNYKSIWLGYYNEKAEAAKAYNKASIKYFGKFARPNEL